MRMGIGTVLCVVALVLYYCGAAHAFVCPEFIYGFGDSLMDTGNAQAEMPEEFIPMSVFPYGKSYRFPDPTRFCDGRLIIDYFGEMKNDTFPTSECDFKGSIVISLDELDAYIVCRPAGSAQAFGFPFLEPYSRRLPDADYSRGVNFAYAGATVISGVPPYPTFYFARQVSNFIDFNAAFTGTVNVSTAMQLIAALGGNDLRIALQAGVPPAGAEMSQLIDQVVELYKQNLERMHKEGARFFYIVNHHPAGCAPYFLFKFAGKGRLDEDGCLSDYNAVFQNLNVKLKGAVESYRKQWPDTTILHFDWYNATLEVIRNPGTYGIQTGGFGACCRDCDENCDEDCCCATSNQCVDPEHILFWDGMHYSEGSNRVSATLALTGKFVDGPFEAVNLKAACNLDFSSFPKSIPNPKTAYF